MFILVGMGVWLLADPRTRRRSLPALAVIALVGLALLPLISAQGARGTQWIGEWALKERIEDIADYYLTGYSGGRLGHSIEALVGLPLFAVVGARGRGGCGRAARSPAARALRQRARRTRSHAGAARCG